MTQGRGPFRKGLAVAPTTSDSFSYSSDQQFAALLAGEAKRLAKHIFGPQGAIVFKERTRAEERQSKNTAQNGLVFLEDEIDIVLHVEEENSFERALRAGIEASVELTTGKIQVFPPPPI